MEQIIKGAHLTKEEADAIRDYWKEHPEELAEVRKQFESTFGVDKATRSEQQWRNLVQKYGHETVCKAEGVTRIELAGKCGEKFLKAVKKNIKFKDRVKSLFKKS